MKTLNRDTTTLVERKLGYFSEEWLICALADVADITFSSVDKKISEDEEAIHLCNYTDVYYNQRIDTSIKFMRATATQREIDRFGLRRGDVIITKDSESPDDIAVPAYVSQDMPRVVCGYHLALIRPDPLQLTGRYLCELLQSHRMRHYFYTLANGVTRFGLSAGSLEKAALPLPPLPEQKNIAEILSTWDEAIEQARRLIDAERRLKKGLMQQLLTGKKRLPGFQTEWQWSKASEVFCRISARSRGKEPVLSATQDNGIVDRSTLDKRIEYDKGNLSSYKVVEPGDFVISLRSFQGGVELSRIRGRVSPAYHVIRGNSDVAPEFYRYYFKSFDFIGRLAIAVIGIRDGKQVSYEDFRFMRVPQPPRTEQEAIAEVLLTMDEEITHLETELKELEKQKRGLMQKLLTGTVRVKA